MNGLARRQVPRRDHNVLAEFWHGAGMLPRLADLFEAAYNVRREASFTGRGSIQNQVAMSAIQRLKPLFHDGRYRLEVSSRVLLFPEPTIRQGDTRKGRHVAVFRDLLSGILLKRLHIGIVETARRILAGVQVAEQAVGLQPLDMLIYLAKRHLLIGNAAPRRIPSVSDEDVNFFIAGEQLRELIFDELYLGRSHVEMADIVAERQNRIVKTDPQAGLAERIYIGAHDVGRMRYLPHACRTRLCRPKAEAIVMPGRQAAPGHVGRERRCGPMIGVEDGGMKHIKG